MAENLKPNYRKASNLATDVLINYSNGILPIDLNYIISNIQDLNIMTFSDWYDSLSSKLPSWASTKTDLIAPLGSNDSILLPGNDRFLLLFNEEFEDTKCRWNIAHELGHYFLFHVKNDYRTYTEIQEKEANCFARHLLTPFYLVSTISRLTNIKSSAGLADYFSVSNYVMNNTINNMNKLSWISGDNELKEKFDFYIMLQEMAQII